MDGSLCSFRSSSECATNRHFAETFNLTASAMRDSGKSAWVRFAGCSSCRVLSKICSAKFGSGPQCCPTECFCFPPILHRDPLVRVFRVAKWRGGPLVAMTAETPQCMLLRIYRSANRIDVLSRCIMNFIQRKPEPDDVESRFHVWDLR